MKNRIRQILTIAHNHGAVGVLMSAREWARLLRHPVRLAARLAHLEAVGFIERRLARRAMKGGRP
jgi:hypothetical protein